MTSQWIEIIKFSIQDEPKCFLAVSSLAQNNHHEILFAIKIKLKTSNFPNEHKLAVKFLDGKKYLQQLDNFSF